MNLYEASNQWANRPNDERFWTLQDAYRSAVENRQNSRTAKVNLKNLYCNSTESGEILINGSTSQASLTHHAMNDLCRQIGAPAEFVRTLPAKQASEVMQTCINRTNKDALLLFRSLPDNRLKLRCSSSTVYARIWNDLIFRYLIDLESYGWKVPPARPNGNNDGLARPATAEDVTRASHASLGIKEGDMIAPAGIYLSDKDMFSCMVLESQPIDTGSGVPMHKGIMVKNAEVPGEAFHLWAFGHDGVCGNHIFWKVADLQHLKIIHKGKANEKFQDQFHIELRKYANSGVQAIEQNIRKAKSMLLASTVEDVIDLVFKRGILGKKDAENAYKYAVIEADTHRAGDPKSVWGYAAGITAYSQSFPYADQRNLLDQAAGKVLEFGF